MQNRSPDSISPELALVDEELDTSARRALPDVPDCLTSADDDAAGATTRRRRRAATKLVAGLGLVALAAALGALLLSDGGHPKRGADTRTTESASTAEPDRPSRLRWRAVRGAAFYNVIFWRNGSRVLDLWPAKATVRVPRARLAPGSYQWFVYPAFAGKGEPRYGKVMARGTLRV